MFANRGAGIFVVGSRNLVTKSKLGDKGKGNDNTGLIVEGAGNLIEENDAYANGGDGINVSGGTSASPNILLKNQAGDRDKGNLKNGIVVAGAAVGYPTRSSSTRTSPRATRSTASRSRDRATS